MSGSGRGTGNPSVTFGDSSPYILRTVTFLWNVPVFRPAYSALPKRSDFSRFAAYEGGAIETMCFLLPLCTLRTSAPKGGMVRSTRRVSEANLKLERFDEVK